MLQRGLRCSINSIYAPSKGDGLLSCDEKEVLLLALLNKDILVIEKVVGSDETVELSKFLMLMLTPPP